MRTVNEDDLPMRDLLRGLLPWIIIAATAALVALALWAGPADGRCLKPVEWRKVKS